MSGDFPLQIDLITSKISSFVMGSSQSFEAVQR